MPLCDFGVFFFFLLCGLSRERKNCLPLDSRFAPRRGGGDRWERDGNPRPVRLISVIGVRSCSAIGDVGVLCWQQTVDLRVLLE